jgi:hypothetical protein
MPDYRLYCLDKKGRILKRHDFEAASDTDALKIASEREDPHLGCEVWELGRKIATLPPKTIADQSPD